MEMSLAKDKLITENYYLIHYVIKNLIDTSSVKNNPLIDYEDLIQCGAVGLCKAADAYDEKKGAFSTLACNTIRNTILNELISKSKYDTECALIDEASTICSADSGIDAADINMLLSNIFSTMEAAGEKDIELKKSLLVLLYEGYSLRSAAKLLNITHQKARVAMSHIKKYVKLALEC